MANDTAISPANPRILVTEDEHMLAFQLTKDLRKMGAVPLGPVSSISAALQIITDEPQIDAAFLNVRLRGERSFPIADELIRRGIPFAFVTAADHDVRHYDVPVHSKPASVPRVAHSLRSLIEVRCDRGIAKLLP